VSTPVSSARTHEHERDTFPPTGGERIWKASLPYLFQRLNGLHRSAVTPTTIRRRLQACCTALAQIHPEFEGITFAPHDFRRLFATELVNSGLPIHIGAALLGHLSIPWLSEEGIERRFIAVFGLSLLTLQA
jgi:integrase